MNDSILFAVFFVWIAVIIYFLIAVIFNCSPNKVVTNVFQKGFDGTDKTKHVYKYICEPIFSGPTTGFDISKACITIELIHANETRTKTRLATLTFDLKDGQINRFLCCKKVIRGFFLIIRHTDLPPITHIRAVHSGSTDSKIFFEGLEIHDQMSGDRTFFAVNNNLLNVEMKDAIVHIIKGQTLRFCSKQTFCPDFYSLNVESFGEHIETPNKTAEVIHGIRLLPKLDWFEEFIFNAYLIHLTFAFMAAIIFYLNHQGDIQKSIASVMISGLISPTVTQVISYSYRSVVKRKYNSNCSPMKVELNQSSNLWLTFKALYLLITFLLTILLSVLAVVLLDENLKLEYKLISDSVEMDVEILILLFVFTLITIYTIWLIIFAVIRFLFRSIFFRPKNVITDVETPTDGPTNDTKGNNDHPKKLPSPIEKSSGPHELSERSESIKSGLKSKFPSKTKPETNDGSATEEQNKYSQLTQSNQLNTRSVIVKPTESLGYIDPDVFKLSESKILNDAKETKQKEKKPKESKSKNSKPKDNSHKKT